MSAGRLRDSEKAAQEQSLFSQSLIYTLSGYAIIPVAMVCNLLTRRELGPYLAGVYGTLTLVGGYVMFVNLGVLSASERDLPYCRGDGDLDRYERIRQSAGSFSLLAGLVFCLVLVGYVWINQEGLGEWLAMGLAVTAVQAVLQQWSDYQTTLLRAEGQFAFLGRNGAICGVAGSVAVLAGVLITGFAGLLTALVLVSLARAVLLGRRSGYVPALSFDFSQTGQLIVQGVPMLVTGLVFIFAQTLDSFLILRWLGIEALGLYGVAISAVGLVIGLSKSAQAVLYPRMMEEYGRSKDMASFARYIVKPGLIVGFLLPLVIAALFLGMPVIVQVLMPRFDPGLPAFRVMVVGVYFWALSQTPVSVLVAVKRERLLLALLAVSMLVHVGIAWWLIGLGIEGVALATVAAFALTWSLVSCAALSDLSVGERLGFLGWLLVPMAATVGLLFAVRTFLPTPENGLWSAAGMTAVQGIAFLAGYLPILWLLDWKTEFFSRFVFPHVSKFWPCGCGSSES